MIRMAAGVVGALMLYGSVQSPAASPAAEPGRSAEDIFRDVKLANARRESHLWSYSSTRKYSVRRPGHPVDASVVVSMVFTAPSTKTFTILSGTGAGWVQKRVFQRLLDAERQAAAGDDKRNSDLSLTNYDVQFLGDDQDRGRECYVLGLSPKRHDKYLLRGKIWIDKDDLAVVKVDAEPETSPSFWIIRAPVLREYERIDGFWLPLKDLTHSQVRILGEYVLEIEYSDYRVATRE